MQLFAPGYILDAFVVLQIYTSLQPNHYIFDLLFHLKLATFLPSFGLNSNLV